MNGRVLLASVLLFLLTCGPGPVKADIRVNLISRLNQLIDDPAGDRKATAAQKYAILNQIGREYGRRGLIVKRDTITTSPNVESYALNADCAGGVQSAYVKRGLTRKGLAIVDRDSAFNAVQVASGVLTYAFMDQDGRIGFQSMPMKLDTVIVLYYAYAAAMATDSTEWDIPDHYEGAALLDAAQIVLFKIGTAEAQERSIRAGMMGDTLLNELRNPPTQTRQIGETLR
jgi:hypothetical protein